MNIMKMTVVQNMCHFFVAKTRETIPKITGKREDMLYHGLRMATVKNRSQQNYYYIEKVALVLC